MEKGKEDDPRTYCVGNWRQKSRERIAIRNNWKGEPRTELVDES